MSAFLKKKKSNGNHTLKSLKSLLKAYFLLGVDKGLCASVNSKALLVAGLLLAGLLVSVCYKQVAREREIASYTLFL